LEMIT